jgi:probable phosphoglycerate mutase
MATTDLFIFRHGETDWNRDQRFQGHTDIPLNAAGRAQAQDLRVLIEKYKPQVIVSSDLSRARETAEIVNTTMKLPFVIDEALREGKLGDSEGMYRDDVTAKYGNDIWDRWSSMHEKDMDFGFPNGETKREHLARMVHHLEKFCRAHPQFQRVAVSSHGGSLRRLIHNCFGAPEAPVNFHNCVLYQISFDRDTGRWLYYGQLEE